jgi:hypothetical protein
MLLLVSLLSCYFRSHGPVQRTANSVDNIVCRATIRGVFAHYDVIDDRCPHEVVQEEV